MEWFKFKNGNGIVRVKDIESACNDFTENIIELFNTQKSRNDRLQEENAILKDEHYKDKKIQELEDKIAELRSELGYSFRMTKEDWDRVREWQIQHQAEKHGLKTFNDRLAAGGTIGGNWTFEFVPTSIGTVGTCICGSCKEEFVFQELI